MSDKMREEFIEWHCSDAGGQIDPMWMIWDEDAGEFAYNDIQRRYSVWKASRAALVVEIDSMYGEPDAASYDHYYADEQYKIDMAAHQGMEDGFRICREALTKAGVTVK